MDKNRTENKEPVNKEPVVLCAVSAYEQKYYLNPVFEKLPESVKEELRTICILYAEEIGGRMVMEFDGEGNLSIRTDALDSDYNYDEIGAALMVEAIRKNRAQMLEELELYFRVIILGQTLEEAGTPSSEDE